MKIKKYILPVLMLILLLSVLMPANITVAQGGGYCDESPGLPEEDCRARGLTWIATGSAGSGGTVCTDGNTIGNLICKVHSILNSIVPVLLALGVVYFVWGVTAYVIGGDEEAKRKGRSKIISGIIGLAVIVSVWGLVNVVVNTFGLSGASADIRSVASPFTSAEGAGCQIPQSRPKVGDLLDYATCIIGNSVIPLFFALAVVMFIWGVVQYVINGDDEAKKTKGKQFMIWGIVGLAVMVSIWGLVNILTNTFGVRNYIPQVQPR